MCVHLAARGVKHLERHNFQVALLKALDYFSDKPLAHTVGLYQNECLFLLWAL